MFPAERRHLRPLLAAAGIAGFRKMLSRVADVAPLRRAYLPDDLRPLLDANGVAGTVLVQATHSLDETRWLQSIADKHGFPHGIAFQADMTDPDLENQIKAASPRFNSLVHTRSLTLDEVRQQVLDDETALLEYSLGEQSSYLWVLTRQDTAVFKLPAGSTMDQLAMDLRSQLIPPKLQPILKC